MVKSINTIKIVVLLVSVAIFSACGKYKISDESIIGTWTFSNYSFYITDSLNTKYTKYEVNESGFITFEKDSSLLGADKIILGKAKLPWEVTINSNSTWYNNDLPHVSEKEFWFDAYTLPTKKSKRGNQNEYFQGLFGSIDPISHQFFSDGNVFELLQKSKKNMVLKMYINDPYGNSYTGIELPYVLIELKKQ